MASLPLVPPGMPPLPTLGGDVSSPTGRTRTQQGVQSSSGNFSPSRQGQGRSVAQLKARLTELGMEIPPVLEKSELEAVVAEAELMASEVPAKEPQKAERLEASAQRGSYHLHVFRDEEVPESLLEASTHSHLSCTRGKNGVTRVLPALDLDASVTMSFLEQSTSADGAVKGQQFTWVKGDLLGRGSLGQVYKALDQKSGRIMAVKEVPISATDDEDQKFMQTLENEIDVVKDLRHPHIVAYLGHEHMDNVLFLYLEYMTGGCLSSLLSQFGAFDECLIAEYSKQILLGLEYLHLQQPPVVHRDIKGANILVGFDGVVKLADFGCSKRTAETVTQTMKGSIPWMAPEVITHCRQGRAADMWSFGCVIIEMATAKAPWGRFDNAVQAMVRIGMSKETPPVPEQLSDLVKDLIAQCIQRAPENRKSAQQMLEHDLLKDLVLSCPSDSP